MPEISVIIPIFNTEKFLALCLESVSAQTFKNFEAILINDGSTDKSQWIAEEFVRRDSRFHLISQKNSGLSEARNTGILAASGNWITFVDSDDILNVHFLQMLYSAAIQRHSLVAVCGKKNFREIPNKDIFNQITNRPEKISSEEALIRAFYQNRIPDHSAWNKLFHKSLWQNRKFPKGIFFEDMAVIPAILWEAQTIAICKAPLYFYRKHKGSILSSAYDLKKAELLAIAEKNLNSFQDISIRVKKAAESLLLSASFSILMRTPDSAEFANVRSRAFDWIRRLRKQSLLDIHTRWRNKVAVLCSFGGLRFLNFILQRLK